MFANDVCWWYRGHMFGNVRRWCLLMKFANDVRWWCRGHKIVDVEDVWWVWGQRSAWSTAWLKSGRAQGHWQKKGDHKISEMFGPKLNPIRPKITQNVPSSNNILNVINVWCRSVESSLKGRFGAELPSQAKIQQNGKFCNRIIRPDLFDIVTYALEYDTAYYTNTTYEHTCFQIV
jgi:hypothetical protein